MSDNIFVVEFSHIGNPSIGKIEVTREFAPRTAALIRFRVKNSYQSRIVTREGEVAIPIKLGRVGPEQSRRDVVRGDVVYYPQGNTLSIFLKKTKVAYPVNFVGHVSSGSIPFFEQLRIGTSIKMELVKPPIDEINYL